MTRAFWTCLAIMMTCAFVPCIARAQATQPATTQPIHVLLLGDSTVAGTYPRIVAPKADHLEQVIQKLLAMETDLPPTNVRNAGRDGNTVAQELGVTTYERDITGANPVPDFIFMRFGINDSRQPDFVKAFPVQYHEFIARLKKDFPAAMITIETVIPYKGDVKEINELIHTIAATENLGLVDTNARFVKERDIQGPNSLTYRFTQLDQVPPKLRSLIPPEAIVMDGKSVLMLDNALDAQFAQVPRWFADRHPNLAGYHVIADEIAKYLAPKIRERIGGTTQPATTQAATVPAEK